MDLLVGLARAEGFRRRQAMIELSVLPGFLLVVLLICVAPGPDMAFIIAASTDRGTRAGVQAALGMAIGMALWTVATSLGLAALLRAGRPRRDPGHRRRVPPVARDHHPEVRAQILDQRTSPSPGRAEFRCTRNDGEPH